jgi:ATP-dependent Clp protease ATP-binding subunit ClpA
LRVVTRLFTSEFRNRLDAIISFRPLDRGILFRIVDQCLMQLEDPLHRKKGETVFTDALRHYLAKEGFDPRMGARPLQPLIQHTIRRVLADALLFGRLVHGGHVTLDVDDQNRIQPAFVENHAPCAQMAVMV